MMKKATAVCPAALSFIFKFCPNPDIDRMGSLGVGCTLDKDITVETSLSPENHILYNGTETDIAPVRRIVRLLTEKTVTANISSPLPLAYGFGISGASSLGTAFALNKLLHLEKPDIELIRLAHRAEIREHTGLGTVGTQSTGGFLVKQKPGIPAQARELPFTGKKLYAIIIGKLATPSILTDETRLDKINRAAEKALRLINANTSPTLTDVFDTAYQYCVDSDLLTNPEMVSVISRLRADGIHTTMAILGHVILTDKKPLSVSYRVEELTITKQTVRAI